MPLKGIIHDLAQDIANRTSPDYVPPPKPPITTAEKQHLIKIKARLEAGGQKLTQMADFLMGIHQELRGYQIEDVDMSAVSNAIRTINQDIKEHLKRIDARLK